MFGKYKNDKSIFDELRLIAQVRNISGYENKSKEDLIKALSETKPETLKLNTPKIISSKLKILKLKIAKPKPRPEIRVNKKKLKKLRKDFDELRHKFDKKEIDRYRKAFYDVKNYENLSIRKRKNASKSLSKLKKSLRFKKFLVISIALIMKTLTVMIYIYDFADDDDEYRKIGSIRTLFKQLDRDYYKLIRTDVGFDGRSNNYIEYTSKAENLSPKEYLNVIIPYLRNLINDHKPIMELNNSNNNNNNNNNDNTNTNTNTNNNGTNAATNSNRVEWKIQLIIKNSFISVKDFEDTHTIFSESEPAEIFMGSDTENIIDTLFNIILNKIQQVFK